MSVQDQMLPAAEAAARIMRETPADRLEDPSPCPGWSVRDLVNHLCLWNARGETAARRQPPGGPGEDHDFTAEPGWADRFAEQARGTAEAWDDPAAWEGKTSLSGLTEGMPAPFVGGLLLSELVLHGWDLAAATGREPGFAPETVQAEWDYLVTTVELGRRYKVFGEEVPVAADAPLLDRVVGLSGRDPRWTP
ncbi:TIGR03086 family metal-binding protein [Actinomadura litoris]|uniref:TIGR03086 family metal-binding protein n=1 Tax=Actinomadura litoris TaxID=2678616 RepID=UPI001FA7C2DA|nr:TIGR03086 family metal-binding protein [Actinomadura litoris]